MAAATIAPGSMGTTAGAGSSNAAPAGQDNGQTLRSIAQPSRVDLITLATFSDNGATDDIQSWSQEGVAGLSQEVGNLAVAAAPQYVDMEVDNRLHAAPMAPVMAPVPQDIILRREVWEEFIQAEIGRHMELVQAAQDDSAVAVRFPASWLELEVILRKMAYDVRTDDAWRTLGFAFFGRAQPVGTIDFSQSPCR